MCLEGGYFARGHHVLGDDGRVKWPDSSFAKGGFDSLRSECTIMSSVIDCQEVQLANLLPSLVFPLVPLFTEVSLDNCKHDYIEPLEDVCGV